MFKRKNRYSWKKAEKRPEPEELLTLFIMIRNAENIDVGSKTSALNYVVICSLEEGKEGRSMAKRGSSQRNPVWDKIWSVPFRMGMYEFFQLEVVRLCSRSDIVGTSTGTLVVGRAHIPLPKKVGVKEHRRYALVKVDEETGCKVDAGHIYVSMVVEHEGGK